MLQDRLDDLELFVFVDLVGPNDGVNGFVGQLERELHRVGSVRDRVKPGFEVVQPLLNLPYLGRTDRAALAVREHRRSEHFGEERLAVVPLESLDAL
jgi:hypothetical protein